MARRGYVQLSNGYYLNRKVRRLRRTMPSAISAMALIPFSGANPACEAFPRISILKETMDGARSAAFPTCPLKSNTYACFAFMFEKSKALLPLSYNSSAIGNKISTSPYGILCS